MLVRASSGVHVKAYESTETISLMSEKAILLTKKDEETLPL